MTTFELKDNGIRTDEFEKNVYIPVFTTYSTDEPKMLYTRVPRKIHKLEVHRILLKDKVGLQ